MITHIVVTRKINDKLGNVVVPLSSASFTEDIEGQVTLHSERISLHITQSMQDILATIKPIGFYST